MKQILITILLCLFCGCLFAATDDIYAFKTTEQQTRFNYLTQQFRCLVCQNEALADSNAPLAKDLRQQIAKLIQTGANDAQITQYLTQRYGDFVLFSPPLKTTTYLLWFGPFILLLIGGLTLFVVVRKNKR